MVTVEWKGDFVFEATPESGKLVTMDTFPSEGHDTKGATPFETFLSGIAACSAYDVVLILGKKRQKVTSYHVVIDGERTEEGVYPRPFKSLTLRHVLSGENLDPQVVDQAIKLSDEKYCSAIATVRAAPIVTSAFEIV
ncbi:MAG: OsmC family protein [Fimbriimonadaceae bacterium]|jgi:putative redox protein|nr:OsmC family protein [Fimbriimonadaceae bacterium]